MFITLHERRYNALHILCFSETLIYNRQQYGDCIIKDSDTNSYFPRYYFVVRFVDGSYVTMVLKDKYDNLNLYQKDLADLKYKHELLTRYSNYN